MDSSDIVGQLDHRITELEKTNQRRRWYSETSNYIALIGVVIAAASFAFSYFSKSIDDTRSKKEELRGIMSMVLDLRYEQLHNTNDPRITGLKQGIYVEAAELLISQIPDKASSQEYIILSEEMALRGDYKKEKSYKEKSVDAANNNYSKVFALRLLANFYFSPRFTDIKKGRKLYEEAVGLLTDTKDDYVLHTLGDTYHAWGLDEIRNGFEDEEGQKIKTARKYYSDITDIARRTDDINNLDKLIMGIKSKRLQNSQTEKTESRPSPPASPDRPKNNIQKKR
jgi:hypothetical protein